MEGISNLGDAILAVKIGTQPGGEDESKDGCQISEGVLLQYAYESVDDIYKLSWSNVNIDDKHVSLNCFKSICQIFNK